MGGDGLYTAFIVLAVALNCVVIFYILSRRFTMDRVWASLILGAAAEIMAAFLFLMYAPDEGTAYAWARLRFLGLSLAPVALLLFASEYTGRHLWITWRRVALLLVIPVLTQIILWAEPLTPLFFVSWSVDLSGSVNVEHYVYTGWFWIHMLYSYFLILLALMLLGYYVFVVDTSVRFTGLVIMALTVTGLVLTLPQSTLPNFPELRLTPIGMALISLGVIWLVLRHHLLNMIPVAYDAIFLNLPDAFLVVDPTQRVVQANPAAHKLVGQTQIIGADILALLPALKPLWEQYRANQPGDMTLAFPDETIYTAQIIPLYRGASTLGCLLTLRDVTESQQAGQKLRESEARYRTLVSTLAEGVVLQNKTGVIEACNEAAEQILGLTVEQMMGRKSIDPRWRSVHEDGSPFPGEEHPAMVTLRTGESLSNVIMGVHKPNGSLTWISINSRPIRHIETGEVVAVVASFADITRRKVAQEALRQSREQLEVVLQGARLGTWNWNIETGEVQFNERWAEMLGYELAEIEPSIRAWEKLTHPDDMLLVTTVLNDHLEGRTPYYETEHRMLAKSGEWVWVLDSGRVFKRDADNHPLQAAGIHMDITERVAAQTALRASEAKLKGFIEQSYDGIVLADEQGIILEWNHAVEALTGTQRHEAVGQPLWMVQALNALRPEDMARMREISPADMLAAFTAEQSAAHQTVTQEIRHRSGEIRSIEMTKFLINGDQKMLGAILRDATERKHAEERTLELAVEQERSQVLARFIRDASHEFRTPMTVIKTLTYLLKRGEHLTPQEERLDMIDLQVDRMIKLIDSLQLMTRLDSGEALVLRPIDLKQVAQLAVELVRSAAEAQGHTLTVELADDLPPVLADANLIQAVHAILNNAVRYTRPGGHIHVATFFEMPYVRLRVRDDGIGMDEETQHQAFMRFYRKDSAHSTEGFGLGLPIAQNIVHASGGDIHLESRPDVGTTVIIELLPAPA